MDHEINLILAIIGIIIGSISIYITIRIYYNVSNIKKKQIENSQKPYESNTNHNMSMIHEHFKNIARITQECEGSINIADDDNDVDVDLYVSMNSRLSTYYVSNMLKMKRLLEKSNRDLELWIDLDENKRMNYKKIIDNFDWMINEFYQTRDNNEEIQLRIWTKNHHELTQKRLLVDRILQ